jgi:hypothetical protein
MAHQLFVAGTLGALFTTVARNMPDIIRDISVHPQLEYTLDRCLRWLYFLWLVVYFFVSNVGLERERQAQDGSISPSDTKYYISQSVLALTAAYFLGFLVPNTQFEWFAYVSSNVAQAVICFLALAWYRNDNNEQRIYGINRLRLMGGITSAIAVTATVALGSRTVELVVLLLLQFVMWVILLQYRRIRINY